MSVFKVDFATTISVRVLVDATDEEDAADRAWVAAEEFLQTVIGDGRAVTAEATLDGIGADSVIPGGAA